MEVNCETDFVARSQEFSQFCRDVAMQVAATSPRYIKREELPKDMKMGAEELRATCLLEQPFVRDQGVAVQDLLKALIAKTGENIVIRRFVKFTVGEVSTNTNALVL